MAADTKEVRPSDEHRKALEAWLETSADLVAEAEQAVDA